MLLNVIPAFLLPWQSMVTFRSELPLIIRDCNPKNVTFVLSGTLDMLMLMHKMLLLRLEFSSTKCESDLKLQSLFKGGPQELISYVCSGLHSPDGPDPDFSLAMASSALVKRIQLPTRNTDTRVTIARLAPSSAKLTIPGSTKHCSLYAYFEVRLVLLSFVYWCITLCTWEVNT